MPLPLAITPICILLVWHNSYKPAACSPQRAAAPKEMKQIQCGIELATLTETASSWLQAHRKGALTAPPAADEGLLQQQGPPRAGVSPSAHLHLSLCVPHVYHWNSSYGEDPFLGKKSQSSYWNLTAGVWWVFFFFSITSWSDRSYQYHFILRKFTKSMAQNVHYNALNLCQTCPFFLNLF